MAMKDRSVLGGYEKITLANERLSFLFDASTTAAVLATRCCYETDPLNTAFGSRNQPGVVSSMAAWELGFSYSSIMIPRWLQHTRYRNIARIAAIVGGSALNGERVKMGFHNIHNLRSGP
jgi:hypothetical protein